MPDPDIFGTTPQNPTEPQSPVQTDPLVEKLMQIKNEKGEPKYKDVFVALDALAASQQFIPTLLTEKQQIEQENAELKKRLEEMGNVQDLIQQFSKPSEPQNIPPTNPNAPVVNEETITKTVQTILESREADRQREQNLKAVIDTVVNAYGDQAGAHINKRATELNISTDQLREMARTSPQVALELLQAKGKTTVVLPSQSSIIPPTSVPDGNEYPTYERGVARGGMSNKELAERWRASTKFTNKRIGLETS